MVTWVTPKIFKNAADDALHIPSPWHAHDGLGAPTTVSDPNSRPVSLLLTVARITLCRTNTTAPAWKLSAAGTQILFLHSKTIHFNWFLHQKPSNYIQLKYLGIGASLKNRLNPPIYHHFFLPICTCTTLPEQQSWRLPSNLPQGLGGVRRIILHRISRLRGMGNGSDDTSIFRIQQDIQYIHVSTSILTQIYVYNLYIYISIYLYIYISIYIYIYIYI